MREIGYSFNVGHPSWLLSPITGKKARGTFCRILPPKSGRKPTLPSLLSMFTGRYAYIQ